MGASKESYQEIPQLGLMTRVFSTRIRRNVETFQRGNDQDGGDGLVKFERAML